MAIITSENFDAFMQAMSEESMEGYVLCTPDEYLKEGMEQLCPDMKWWPLGRGCERVSATSKDFPSSIAFRKKRSKRS